MEENEFHLNVRLVEAGPTVSLDTDGCSTDTSDNCGSGNTEGSACSGG